MRFRVLLSLVGAAACGEPCVINPCPLGFAINVTVTSATTGAPVAATVNDGRNEIPCSNTCIVLGGPGTYHLQVSAAGYSTATSDVTVTGKPAPKCGCERADTKSLTIALTPAG